MRALLPLSFTGLLLACSEEKLTPVTTTSRQEDARARDSAPREPTLQERGEEWQDEANTRAREAREQALARPNDVDAQVAAALACYAAADLEMRRALVESLATEPVESVDELLERDSDLSEEVKDRVVELCESGMSCASAAIELDGSRADARFFYASNLGLAAWGKGAVAVVLEGLALKVKRSLQDALDADEEFDGGAPLRALGAFYARAPWPAGDKDEARELLSRAVALSPTVITRFYYGDLLWRMDDHEAAVEQWRKAETAEPGSLPLAAPFLREVARLAAEAAAE